MERRKKFYLKGVQTHTDKHTHVQTFAQGIRTAFQNYHRT